MKMVSKQTNPANEAINRDNALAQMLEEQRLNANLTKRAFAQKLGISSAYLYQLLNGVANPTWETMEELAASLNLEFSPTYSRKRPPELDGN
jgi:transcriptional regulator with XRE-family HTH domain